MTKPDDKRAKKEKILSSSEKILKSQKKVYLFVCVGILLVIWGVFSLFGGKREETSPYEVSYNQTPPETASHNLDPENFRLSQIEWKQDSVMVELYPRDKDNLYQKT